MIKRLRITWVAVAAILLASAVAAKPSYGPAYAKGLATCVTLLEQGDLGVIADWSRTASHETVCRASEDCTTYKDPDGFPVIILRDGDTCFGSWTARVIGGADEPVAAVFEVLTIMVSSGRLIEVEPRPFDIDVRMGISEVFIHNSPPLAHLRSYVGCTEGGHTLLVNFYAAPERMTRFETARMPKQGPDCIALVS